MAVLFLDKTIRNNYDDVYKRLLDGLKINTITKINDILVIRFHSKKFSNNEPVIAKLRKGNSLHFISTLN